MKKLCLALLGISPCLAYATHNEAGEESVLPTVSVAEALSVAERNQLPATTESVTRAQIVDTVNLINTEDALKYLPSVMVRKRHSGDTQAPMTTRTSGPGQSARSLVYADGVLLSALIGNNNTNASPRWSMVAPEEIERIDVMYGPFSAAYAGNSIGAVAEITTRMPTQFEGSVKGLISRQDFSLYGTQGNYRSDEVSATLGNRVGDLAWWFSANHLDSQSNPLSFATLTPSGAAGTPVTGAFADTNRSGQSIIVVGAGGLEHKQQDNFKLKLAYDLRPGLRATYTVGLFQNQAQANMQTYLRDAATSASVYSGTISYGGNFYNIGTALSAGQYRFEEEHLMQSFSLKSSADERWNWEALYSRYDYLTSSQRIPGSAAAALSGGAGTRNVMDGTGWQTADVKGFWRPNGATGTHQFSFGAHYDQYVLANPVYATSDWLAGGNGAINSESRGKTRTQALWAQDVWRVAKDWRATVGGRYEQWRAFDGYNYSASPALNVSQPELSANAFSPKLSLAWDVNDTWLSTASLGKAYRFPTVTELYQSVTTGATLSVPNPDLRPERGLSGELALERHTAKRHVRVSLFQENLADALISYRAPLSGTFASYVQNVDKVRSRGVELSMRQEDGWIKGLELSGSVTYVDSKILAASNFYNAANVLTDVAGKRTPNIPTWRATLVATYRPNDKLATTLAARYSDRLWSTLDNTDVNAHTYQGFESYFVVDARVSYKFDRQVSGALGIDNLNNRKYFLFHPFPQRTVTAELRMSF